LIVDLLFKEKRRCLTTVSGVAGGVVALGETKSGVGGSSGSVHGGGRGGSGNWSSGDRGRAAGAGRRAGGLSRAGGSLGGSRGSGSLGGSWLWAWGLGWALSWLSWVKNTLAAIENLLRVGEWCIVRVLVLEELAELLGLGDLVGNGGVGSNAAGWSEVGGDIISSDDLLWVRVVSLGDATTSLGKLGVVQIADWRAAANSVRGDEPLAEALCVREVVLDSSDVILDIGSSAESSTSWWSRCVVSSWALGRSDGGEAGKDSDKGGGVEQHFDFGCCESVVCW